MIPCHTCPSYAICKHEQIIECDIITDYVYKNENKETSIGLSNLFLTEYYDELSNLYLTDPSYKFTNLISTPVLLISSDSKQAISICTKKIKKSKTHHLSYKTSTTWVHKIYYED